MYPVASDLTSLALGLPLPYKEKNADNKVAEQGKVPDVKELYEYMRLENYVGVGECLQSMPDVAPAVREMIAADYNNAVAELEKGLEATKTSDITGAREVRKQISSIRLKGLLIQKILTTVQAGDKSGAQKYQEKFNSLQMG